MTIRTAIGEKLAAKGYLAHNVELNLAIAKFQNNGGEYGVALAMLNAAYGKGSEGLDPDACKGSGVPADASRQNDGDEGQCRSADKAFSVLPSSPSPDRSASQSRYADKAMVVVPREATPNLPGHARRGLAAISAVQDTVAKSLFDTTRLPDGRALREVCWSEVPHLASRYTFLSRVMMAVHHRGVPVDANATLDTLVTETELTEIIGAVERLNDIH